MDFLGCSSGSGAPRVFGTCAEFGNGAMITLNTDHFTQPGRIIKIRDIVVGVEPSWIINKRRA